MRAACRFRIALVALAALGGPAAASPGFGDLARAQVVVLSGAEAGALLGTDVSHIWAYRYDAGAAGFVQVPLQIDERAWYDLTDGGPFPVYELTYDWAGADDGTLDADDELALMPEDAGDPAPDTATWVPGAEDTRVEVRIEDPLDGTTRWLYLFASSTITDETLQTSYVTYVTLNPLTGAGWADAPRFRVRYGGRWLLERIRIDGGPDVLDRVKVRGHRLVGADNEDTIEPTAELLGIRSGKVRVLREVRGADSAPLTTHVDQFTRDSWIRTLHLRIHPMSEVWHYADYVSPATPGRFYSSALPAAGIPLDGLPDSPALQPVPSWSQASLPDATIVVYERELTPFPADGSCASEAGAWWYWRDDAGFNDGTGNDPGAFGNHGFRLRCLADTNLAPYSRSLKHYLLPPQDPYAPIGTDYALREENPLQVTTQAQQRQALTIPAWTELAKVGGGRLRFDWLDALGEERYEVYRGELTAPFGYGHDSALACDVPADATSWTTADDQQTGQPSYYYLIVPARGAERAYGAGSDGTPRPPSAAPCPVP